MVGVNLFITCLYLTLRMTFEFGKKQKQTLSFPYGNAASGDTMPVGSKDWTALAEEVSQLCAYFTPLLVSPIWAGNMILQCMMHFNGVDKEFRGVLGDVLNGPAEGRTSNERLDDILRGLGVLPSHIERLVLKRAMEIVNSVPSCESEDLNEVKQLLALLPERSSPSMSFAIRLVLVLALRLGLVLGLVLVESLLFSSLL
jgi:hypothetical protein